MGRRASDRDSSLELLLDTITNTFGGILFIAILVSLLLRTSSRSAQESTTRAEPMTAVEQADLEVRVAALQDEARNLRERIASAPEPGDSSADEHVLGQLSAAAAEASAALAERAEAAQNTLELQRQAATATEQYDSLTETKKSVEDRLAAAENQLAAAHEKAAELAEAAIQLDRPPGATEVEQTVSLPSLRPSMKDEVGLYIRFDRVFMMHAWRGGERLGPNTDQFVVAALPAGGGVNQVARPKPGAGLLVNPASIRADLRRLLQPFPPGQFVVGLIVFEDSFDVFQLIKAAIVEAGYEYRPLALRPGESVVDFGGTGEAQ
ncbi:MAG: hypothetical protein ACKO1M_01850 [Planctomycetota bacterium]